ncbi:MAG: agmatinase [Promethearchaeota archaeon]
MSQQPVFKSHHPDGFGSFAGLALKESGVPYLLQEADILIQGIPYEAATSGKKGTSFAPHALRAISKDFQVISRRGVDLTKLKICDVGNIPIFPVEGAQTRDSITSAMQALLNATSSPIISIGGDHSVTFPLVKAFDPSQSLGIIWLDAHRDLQDVFLGSPFSHGTSLRRISELPNVDPKNICLIGTRYMDPLEQVFIEKTQIQELTAPMLEDAPNYRSLVQKTISEIEDRVDHLYISIDIDVLDPAFAPGTGTPVAGGLTSAQLLNIVSDLSVPVRAFDIVEVSPPLDPSGITSKVQMALLTEIFAKYA